MTTTSSTPTPPPPPPPPPAPGPPPPPRAPAPRRRPVWLVAVAALAVSLLSMVVALASLASARAARDEAADAERMVEALSPGSAGSPGPTTGPVAPTTGPPAPTSGPQVTEAPPRSFNPQAAFTVRYSDEVLNPQVTRDDDAFVDLDEPRVVFNFNDADLVLERTGFGSDPPSFNLQESEVTAAEAGTPEVTPEECLERIRTSPLPPGAEVPAQRGTVLCVLTSLARAAEQGIGQKLVVLHVSALGDGGRVTIEVDAWEQPR